MSRLQRGLSGLNGAATPSRLIGSIGGAVAEC